MLNTERCRRPSRLLFQSLSCWNVRCCRMDVKGRRSTSASTSGFFRCVESFWSLVDLCRSAATGRSRPAYDRANAAKVSVKPCWSLTVWRPSGIHPSSRKTLPDVCCSGLEKVLRSAVERNTSPWWQQKVTEKVRKPVFVCDGLDFLGLSLDKKESTWQKKKLPAVLLLFSLEKWQSKSENSCHKRVLYRFRLWVNFLVAWRARKRIALNRPSEPKAPPQRPGQRHLVGKFAASVGEQSCFSVKRIWSKLRTKKLFMVSIISVFGVWSEMTRHARWKVSQMLWILFIDWFDVLAGCRELTLYGDVLLADEIWVDLCSSVAPHRPAADVPADMRSCSGAAQQPQSGDKNSSLKVGRVKQKQDEGRKKSADASLRSAGNGQT